jgi:release factor glutamine methyltransferase
MVIMEAGGADHLVSRLRAAGCVYAEDEARLLVESADGPDELEGMVARRVAGEPLEYVLGWTWFCGLRIAVDPGVFVPRRRSEFLVAQAVALAPSRPVVVDLCCGTGALGAAVAAAVPGCELHTADIDPVAVACAGRNVSGPVYQGDLFDALPDALRGRVNLLLANVPYVPSEDIALLPREAQGYEARIALDGGADGLHLLRRVGAAAPDWLARTGCVLFETAEHQVTGAVAALAVAGLTAWAAHSAEFDTAVVIGRLDQRVTPVATGRSRAAGPLVP